ncbi:hypothetical protein [Pseudonocardia sp. MH-G8]|uniref:hypothetical protein n=1 Tax=Pseudonocardia sp. MH-G8 TaxID=1854588 RepID=UPI000BA13523|nr:hypothetical protein [Pseudonocardia sp. MH-G8]OZM78953.1 hypothetical protein CFP66_28810 [Pseudonocardia sp. MH-G8]
MPLLLTRSDLRPLANSDDALDGAIDAVEASLLSSHAGDRGETTFTGLTLPNGDELASQFAASAEGANLRIFPRTFEGTRRNAWVGMEISGTTGGIESLIALDDLNNLRTSVPAAVGVRHLAREGATTLAILGSGAMAHSHARTIARVMPSLETVRVWSPTPQHREVFAKEIAQRLDLDATAADTIEAAVEAADVITAAGRYRPGQPALPDPTAVRAGTLLVSMTGSGMNLLEGGARLVVPTFQRPELISSGFSSGFLEQGSPAAPANALQLAEVILGNVPELGSGSTTLVYELGAPYLWDMPIFGWIREWARTRGAGSRIDFSS